MAQNCFGLSDEGIEDALYDSQAIRRFVGIDLARESAPDATTLLKFRRLLEERELTASICCMGMKPTPSATRATRGWKSGKRTWTCR